MLLNSLIDNILSANFSMKLVSYKSKLHQNCFHNREIHCFIHSSTFWKICYSILINRVNELLGDWLFSLGMRKLINIILWIVSIKLPIILYKRYFVLIFRIEVLLEVCLIILNLMMIIKIVFIFILIGSILCFTALIDAE